MPVKDIEYCDMCYADGEDQRAVAQYLNDSGELWFACGKHLKLVKEAGLEYEMLRGDQDAQED